MNKYFKLFVKYFHMLKPHRVKVLISFIKVGVTLSFLCVIVLFSVIMETMSKICSDKMQTNVKNSKIANVVVIRA